MYHLSSSLSSRCKVLLMQCFIYILHVHLLHQLLGLDYVACPDILLSTSYCFLNEQTELHLCFWFGSSVPLLIEGTLAAKHLGVQTLNQTEVSGKTDILSTFCLFRSSRMFIFWILIKLLRKMWVYLVENLVLDFKDQLVQAFSPSAWLLRNLDIITWIKPWC